MPRTPNTRSAAQARQTTSLHVLRTAPSRVPPIVAPILLRRRLPSLFNTYRDRVRDCLSSVNPTGLPRFGQVPIPASDIFVHMCRFEGDRHLVSFKFTCNDKSHWPRTKGSSATFVLVVHSMSPAEDGLIEKPTL